MNRNYIVVGVVAVVAIFLALPYLGIDLGTDGLFDLTTVPEDSESITYNNHDIYSALCVLTGKALPWLETDAYIDSLHMKMYGVDGEIYTDIEVFYNAEWASEGYIVYTDGYDYQTGYTTYSGIFYNGALGKAVVAGSGAGVTSVYGYDCVFIVADGPLTTFVAFATMVASA